MGRGLRSWVRTLILTLAVVEVELALRMLDRPTSSLKEALGEAIRQADRLLLHLADPASLIAALDVVEHQPLDERTWPCAPCASSTGIPCRSSRSHGPTCPAVCASSARVRAALTSSAGLRFNRPAEGLMTQRRDGILFGWAAVVAWGMALVSGLGAQANNATVDAAASTRPGARCATSRAATRNCPT